MITKPNQAESIPLLVGEWMTFSFENNQMVCADDPDGPWRDLGPDGHCARYVRIKRAELDKAVGAFSHARA